MNIANGARVFVVSGHAHGCEGTVRAQFPDSNTGKQTYGVELDEPHGLNDGRAKAGSPVLYPFHCDPLHGIYLHGDALELQNKPRSEARYGYTDYGPEMLGRKAPEAHQDVAVTGSPHMEKAPIAPWGSSYVEVYAEGDWDHEHNAAVQETKSWGDHLVDVEKRLAEKRQEMHEAQQDIENLKIKGKWKEIHEVETCLDQIKKQGARLKKELHTLNEPGAAGKHAINHENVQRHGRLCNENLLDADVERIKTEMKHSPAFDAVAVRAAPGHGAYETDISNKKHDVNFDHEYAHGDHEIETYSGSRTF